MVVTRQSTHRDTGETGEESPLEPAPTLSRASMEFQPPMSFVFQPPNQVNTAEEFGECHNVLLSHDCRNLRFGFYVFSAWLASLRPNAQ